MSYNQDQIDLTVEELKSMEGFQDYSEQECLEYIQQVKNIALVFFKLFEQKKHENG